MAIVKSMHTDQFNHAPAQIFLNTGSPLPGRPSMGAWVCYGLGSESSDLPGFVVLSSGSGISGGAANWSSGFLPTSYQGVPFRTKGDPILDVTSPDGIDRRLERDSLDLIGDLNRRHFGVVGDPEINTRISCVRDGLPDAIECSRVDGPVSRSGIDAGALRRRAGQAVVCRQLVCWPGGWSSEGSGSSTSITRGGTITPTLPGD